MGQKTNPTSLRIGNQKDWKTTFSEKKKWEAGVNHNINSQIIDLLNLFLLKRGLRLQDYRIQHGESQTIVFASVFSTPRIVQPKSSREYEIIADKKNKRQLKINGDGNLATPGHLARIISLMVGGSRVSLNLSYANKQLNLCRDEKQNIKKKFLALRRYKTRDFFIEGFDTGLALTFSRDFAGQLTSFVVEAVKTTKRFKPLLKFLEKSIGLLTDDPLSKTTGVRIEVRGRFNKAGRARFFKLIVGDVPRHSRRVPLEYNSDFTQNKNGSFGVKVWVVGKKCFFNRKKLNIGKPKKVV